MKYVDEYRDPRRCRQLVARIRQTATRRRTIMEVCGGQTHGLLRYGIDRELEGVVELIHGPGCPVCVTPMESIDAAIELARRPDVTLASFGDMLRVPGSRESLLAARAENGSVRIVYSPLDDVRLAARQRDRQVVFFAVGYETTAPATAIAVRQADRLGLDNFSLLVSHVRVQPAMELLAADPACRVEGFLAAGHVCAVTGYSTYRSFVQRFSLPVVVTGFEPVDLLQGILECVEQLEEGRADVVNRYGRSVEVEGNRAASALVDQIYEVSDCPWRGLGVIPGGGFVLRDQWKKYDALSRYQFADSPAINQLPVMKTAECRSGEVLAGRIKPTDCECFGTDCTPDTPLGAPMVSSEGACAAYHRYHRLRQ